ncbi:MAG: hypothetical protein K0Q89_40 [Thermomicrobiales bacterium]|jgi:hypothetical protein|nr:hypothetical protein [Thermomicrobiales bacterium]
MDHDCGDTPIPNTGDDETWRQAVIRLNDEVIQLTRAPGAAQHIVITGTPVDGFNHIGPFDDPEVADGWAEEQRFPWGYWVIELSAVTTGG